MVGAVPVVVVPLGQVVAAGQGRRLVEHLAERRLGPGLDPAQRQRARLGGLPDLVVGDPVQAEDHLHLDPALPRHLGERATDEPGPLGRHDHADLGGRDRLSGQPAQPYAVLLASQVGQAAHAVVRDVLEPAPVGEQGRQVDGHPGRRIGGRQRHPGGGQPREPAERVLDPRPLGVMRPLDPRTPGAMRAPRWTPAVGHAFGGGPVDVEAAQGAQLGEVEGLTVDGPGALVPVQTRQPLLRRAQETGWTEGHACCSLTCGTSIGAHPTPFLHARRPVVRFAMTKR